MLGRLVVRASELKDVPGEFDGLLSVLSETDIERAGAMETSRALRTSKPTYCEVPVEGLDEVKRAEGFAKIRTGGVTEEAIPSVESVASFLVACAERRIAFKATAGLHHPIRAVHALTYESNAPQAFMHGFLNVFLAAAFAWHGKQNVEAILGETDPSAFRFGDAARWRDWSLTAEEVAIARSEFVHSFGSCSFEEPVDELRALRFL